MNSSRLYHGLASAKGIWGAMGRALVSSFVDSGLSFMRPDAAWQRSRSLAGASISGVEILCVLRGKTRIVAFPSRGPFFHGFLSGFTLLPRKSAKGRERKRGMEFNGDVKEESEQPIFILGRSLGTGLVRCLVRTVSIIYRLFSHATCSSCVRATDYFPIPK